MFLVPLVVAVLTVFLAAQQASVELPKYTEQQRWNRAATSAVLGNIMPIALGKAKGMTIDEIGNWLGNQYARTWNRPGTPRMLLNGLYWNFVCDPQGTLEVLSASENEITFRGNRPYLAVFGDMRISYGVTVEEYEKVGMIIDKAIAEWMGLAIEEKIEGPWWITTIRKK
jgi:hypothetical protein